MFRLLVMNNIRSLRPTVLTSSKMRRYCPLCSNHLLQDYSGKPSMSIYDKRRFQSKLCSKELSVMAGVDDRAENLALNEETIDILEELEEIRPDSELLESLMRDDLSSIASDEPVKTKTKKLKAPINRDLLAKVKLAELEKMGREKNLNDILTNYFEMCVQCGFLNKAFLTLNFYLNKNKDVRITSVDVFNKLMQGYSRTGNYDKVMEIWSKMEEEKIKPDELSFICRLESIALSTKVEKTDLIKSTLSYMTNQGIKLNDLFNKCRWKGNSWEVVLKTIRAVHPRFNPVIIPPELQYNSSLLNHLNCTKEDKLKSPCEGLLTGINPMRLFEEQVRMESKCYFQVKSIEKPPEISDNLLKCRSKLEELEQSWSKNIIDGFSRDLKGLANMYKSMHFPSKLTNIYPYLIVLDKNDYKEILLYQIKRLALGSETFSPTSGFLYKEIAHQVKMRYDMKKITEDGILDKTSQIYNDYIKWYLDPSSSTTLCKNGRQQWQLTLYKNQLGSSIDPETSPWPNSVLNAIGKFLYKIILRDIKIDFNAFRQNQPPQLVPAFYPVYRYQGKINTEELKPHPVLSRLYREAHLPNLDFNVSELPMLTPPIPWTTLVSGGYIISKTNIIRLPYMAVQQWKRLKEVPLSQLYPSFDALNQLACIPWKINTEVLDLVIDVFNNGGSSKLNIPEPPSSCVVSDPILPTNNLPTKSEKYLAYRKRMLLRRKKAEMYSLWCDTLYRLSLANHFRDRIFWLPHNMDFRGRVYPCPPHLNHLGSDMPRSLLMFALGKPLGPEGFKWLKLQVVNLTGLKKRDSIDDRLKFADEIMPEILDSANNPLNGNRWWTKSEEPWQTLACCMEIKKALECPDGVESYICHYPVHQDGSCNGLQHYAALGRDSAGAVSVNLAPSSLPQDVYSCVLAIVERERAKDAANGVKIASVLEGFVKRKVIKQTVMTTVYGVTRFGARLQIAKQLKDVENFPKEYVWHGSMYLVAKTFASLGEMFSSTKEIQDWFTECAKLISQVCGQNVEYVTPLGLPVVQPYYRYKDMEKRKYSHAFGNIAENTSLDMFERPNVMKQKNAFPPNFIHSLDSSHMMLTSLHCEQEGITFVSVHDCFWTHPSTVQIMNKICREQFVALHSQPILQDLSDFLIKKFAYSEQSLSGDEEAIASAKLKLNSTLSKVPQTGDFQLEKVLDSVYFFS